MRRGPRPKYGDGDAETVVVKRDRAKERERMRQYRARKKAGMAGEVVPTASKAPEWRLIETAPQDRRAILVCGGRDSGWEDATKKGYKDAPSALERNETLKNMNGPRVAWWCDHEDEVGWWVSANDYGYPTVIYIGPTHWVALPEVPG